MNSKKIIEKGGEINMKAHKWVAGMMAFVVVAASGVSAQSVGSLVNSGDHVRLSQDSVNETRVDVSNHNSANISQSAFADISTGGNSADRNISHGGVAGGVVSGDAFFGASFDASGNSNATVVSVPAHGGFGGGQLTDIVNTGDHVHASSDTSNVTDVSVTNHNDAWINQSAFFDASTGRNSADRNIGGGSVVSGNVGFGADFSASANENVTAVSAGSGFPWVGSGSSLGLVNTGDHVSGSSDTTNLHAVSVENHNALWLDQSSFSSATTGKNSAERGVGGGFVHSGGVGGSAFFDAGHSNSNMTFVDASPWSGLLLGTWGAWLH